MREASATSFHLVPPPDGRLSEAGLGHVFAGDDQPDRDLSEFFLHPDPIEP